MSIDNCIELSATCTIDLLDALMLKKQEEAKQEKTDDKD